MTRTGIDFQGIARNLEYNPVGGVYSDAPLPCKVAFERLRLPHAIKAVAIDAFEKVVDALRHLRVALDDVAELILGFVVPDLFHAERLRLAEDLLGSRCFALACLLAFFSASPLHHSV